MSALCRHCRVSLSLTEVVRVDDKQLQAGCDTPPLLGRNIVSFPL